ncbi:MAG: hypothetical protein H3C39_03385 [Flavobacteriia bacterium]|nr:hypothetical protein [Flavobacteriia bacterium]
MKLRKRATATLIIVLLISGFGYGQFFEDQQEQDAPFSDNSGYFDGSGPNYEQPGDGDNPEYGEDGPGNPGGPRLPIDDWLFLLPIAGAAVGAYFLRRRKQKAY